ncbi:MAG: (Fe-S)-binding protein [Polyangiaceae bacterium]|nr:(Fe-S)-binding protein [Polyangiaceae bacterium]
MDTATPFPEIIEAVKKAGGQANRLCFQCGKCDVVCPWNRVRSFSIRRVVREASLGLSEIELDEIWRCTTCGTCPSTCPRGVGQIEVGVAIRRIATSYDVFPGAARSVPAVGANLALEGNPLGQPRGERDAWAEGLGVKPFAEGMELCYFVGCYGSYDPRMRKVAVATVKILQRAGVDFGILGSDESCCGESIRKTGNEAVFRTLAKHNIKAFIDRGVKRILVSSPHCYHAFKNEYPELMVHFEVVHVAQLLAELVATGRLALRRAPPQKVTYHDPCYLGRHNGIYDEPRRVLGTIPGLALVEMPDHHAGSLCCGGGGGRIWMDTPKGERFADLRLAQARAVGADVLVTSCPYCISNFEESRLGLEAGDAPQVKDLTELVAAALDEAEAP